MITRSEFAQIDTEIKESISEAFKFLKDSCIDHNYILFIADGEYKNYLEPSYNPYTIDNIEDRYKDESRQNFFYEFMRLFYSFPKNLEATEDNEYALTIELMIYTHIWESKPLLKQLFRLATLSTGANYPWYVEIPDKNRHLFIRNEIRDVLRKSKLNLAEIITKGFHTSLRNAFAHSEYNFDDENKQIHLDTYKGESWDIQNISYNDWTKRFVYSSLLSYHFINERLNKRQTLISDFGTDKYLFIHPITDQKSIVKTLHYEIERDGFNIID